MELKLKVEKCIESKQQQTEKNRYRKIRDSSDEIQNPNNDIKKRKIKWKKGGYSIIPEHYIFCKDTNTSKWIARMRCMRKFSNTKINMFVVSFQAITKTNIAMESKSDQQYDQRLNYL